MDEIYRTKKVSYDNSGIVNLDKNSFLREVPEGYTADEKSYQVTFCETCAVMSVKISQSKSFNSGDIHTFTPRNSKRF